VAIAGPAKGRIVWSWTPPVEDERENWREGIVGGPLAAPDGTVYVVYGGRQAKLQALSASGDPLWSLPVRESWAGPVEVPLTLAAGGILLVPTAGGLVRVDPSGAIAGVVANARGSTATVRLDGALYVGTDLGLTAFATDGNVLWTCDLDGGSVGSPPAIAGNGSAYVPIGAPSTGGPGHIGGGVAAVDRAGNKRWRIDLPDNWGACAASPNGDLILAGTPGVAALGPDGDERWRFAAPWGCTAVALGSDGTVFAPSRDGVYCLTPKGAQRWHRSFKGWAWPGAVAVDRNDSVYVRLDSQVFAATKGKKLAWVVEFPDMQGDPSNWESRQLPRTGVALAGGGRVYACSPKTLYAIGD
jgi:hypothetical protein